MKQGESGDRDDVVPVPGLVPTSLGFLEMLEMGSTGSMGVQEVLATQVHAYIHIHLYN